ncbi:hypothetical protein ACH5RR_012063 [Cinchona calisaya]|uniref:Uncharacterized protein n=1 Tax=Cinchona calisaya TaxID=153742 RepID=A0ABD3A991_9GENT
MELDIKYFDLGLPHRDATDDKVTFESAKATLQYDFFFSFFFPCSDGPSQYALEGMHLEIYTDQLILLSKELENLSWVFVAEGADETTALESIYAFADASMNTAYQKKWPLCFSTKKTVLKIYDGRVKEVVYGLARIMMGMFKVISFHKESNHAHSMTLEIPISRIPLRQVICIIFLHDNLRLLNFTEKLESACITTVESGKMTKGSCTYHPWIQWLCRLSRDQYLNTEEFIDAVADELRSRLSCISRVYVSVDKLKALFLAVQVFAEKK